MRICGVGFGLLALLTTTGCQKQLDHWKKFHIEGMEPRTKVFIDNQTDRPIKFFALCRGPNPKRKADKQLNEGELIAPGKSESFWFLTSELPDGKYDLVVADANDNTRLVGKVDVTHEKDTTLAVASGGSWKKMEHPETVAQRKAFAECRERHPEWNKSECHRKADVIVSLCAAIPDLE